MDAALKQHMRENFDAVWLRSEADVDEYESAVEAFERDGDRAALFRRLMALGLTAGDVRWHAVHPGQRMLVTYPDDDENEREGSSF
jgi:hypothetical protein